MSSFPDAKCCANAASNEVDPAIGHACSPSGHKVLSGAAATTAFRLTRARLEAFSTHALLTSEYPVGQVWYAQVFATQLPVAPSGRKTQACPSEPQLSGSVEISMAMQAVAAAFGT